MGRPRNYNAVQDFIDQNLTKGLGDKAAFIDAHTTLTYQQLHTASNQMANVLTNLGARRESRIGLLLFDTTNFPVCYWGALRAGVVPVCLNTLLTTDQYQYLLQDSRIQTLFISADLLKMITPVIDNLDRLKNIVVVDGENTNHGYLVFEDLMDNANRQFATAQTSPDEVAFWLYSSGSTGDPKGVRHVHSSLAHVAKHFGQGVLEITSEDVIFSAAKLFFAYAQGGAMAIPMWAGATTVLLADRPTPQSVMATLKQHNPSVFFGVPTLYANMLADANCTPKNCSNRLRLCVSAGEALPGDVGKSWKAKMGLDVVDGVGSTEMLNAFVSNRPGSVRYGTSGRQFNGYDLKLVDENGNLAKDGEIGELLVSGGSAAEGYWNQRLKSRQTFAGKWVCTGDKYYIDADGFYHYCGRTDDMFKVGGRWVSPFEVEQALVSHPSVLEAAVVAKRDAKDLIKPKAYIILNKDTDTTDLFETLKQHVKTAIGPWKYPRWIDFVPDLPKTATGKVQRYKLRD